MELTAASSQEGSEFRACPASRAQAREQHTVRNPNRTLQGAQLVVDVVERFGAACLIPCKYGTRTPKRWICEHILTSSLLIRLWLELLPLVSSFSNYYDYSQCETLNSQVAQQSYPHYVTISSSGPPIPGTSTDYY